MRIGWLMKGAAGRSYELADLSLAELELLSLEPEPLSLEGELLSVEEVELADSVDLPLAVDDSLLDELLERP